MKLKKIVSGVVTAAMVGTLICGTAFAAASDNANGTYTGEIHFLNANGSGAYSMCDAIFAHEADVVLTDNDVELTFYVAYPLPAFSDEGPDGTLSNVRITAGGQTYLAETDSETKAVKTFDTTSALFGITAGDELPTQAVTVELPREAVDELEAGTVSCTTQVDAGMGGRDTSFLIQVTDLETAAGTATEDTADTTITAEVGNTISAPNYTVTVPSSITMGTLSASAENKQAYSVSVAADGLNGSLSISAPGNGELISGSNVLAFANSFGTQTVTTDTTGTNLNGEISVTAADVAAAATGNYVGTTTFSITYTAN